MLSESGQSIVTLSMPPRLRDPTATLGGATGRPLDVYIESRQRRRSAFLGKRRKQSTLNEARSCLMRAVASPEFKSVDSQALMVAGLPRRTALEMCHEFMAKSANLIVGAGECDLRKQKKDGRPRAGERGSKQLRRRHRMDSIPGNFNVHLAPIEAPGCTTTSAASRTVSL